MLLHQQAIMRDQQSIFTMVLKYGLGTGFNIHANGRVWLLSFDLFGRIDYSTVSGEGEGEPGKGKVDNSHNIFSLKADLNLICQFRYFH